MLDSIESRGLNILEYVHMFLLPYLPSYLNRFRICGLFNRLDN
jgi:hypothetical protein